MKKLIAIPTFDEDGILDGIEVKDWCYIPDEVIIDDKTIKMMGRGVNELPELPKIVFDVTDTEGFTSEELSKLPLSSSESKIVRARLFLKNRLSGHFMNKVTNTATSLR